MILKPRRGDIKPENRIAELEEYIVDLYDFHPTKFLFTLFTYLHLLTIIFTYLFLQVPHLLNLVLLRFYLELLVLFK